jgi:hypothetical protein
MLWGSESSSGLLQPDVGSSSSGFLWNLNLLLSRSEALPLGQRIVPSSCTIRRKRLTLCHGTKAYHPHKGFIIGPGAFGLKGGLKGVGVWLLKFTHKLPFISSSHCPWAIILSFIVNPTTMRSWPQWLTSPFFFNLILQPLKSPTLFLLSPITQFFTIFRVTLNESPTAGSWVLLPLQSSTRSWVFLQSSPSEFYWQSTEEISNTPSKCSPNPRPVQATSFWTSSEFSISSHSSQL